MVSPVHTPNIYHSSVAHNSLHRTTEPGDRHQLPTHTVRMHSMHVFSDFEQRYKIVASSQL